MSLAGTTSGFVVHALAAALGLSALLAAVPVAYDVVRWAGAVYLAVARDATPGARERHDRLFARAHAAGAPAGCSARAC